MFAQRIRSLRLSKKISQDDLAKLVGKTQQAIYFWEKGNNEPGYETLCKLADFFSVTTDYLLGRSDILLDQTPIPGTTHTTLPILGTIHAYLPILTEENYEGYLEVPACIHADYVLRMAGDSMIGAGILDGDYAICVESENPLTAGIIVVLKDDCPISEATLRYYFKDNGNPKLKAANPNYSDLNYEGYRCAGHMVALIRKDAPRYQHYQAFLVINYSEEWTKVIEWATQAGLKANQVKEILAGQIEIAKKLTIQ
jgi:SOS-response transcriptional repressors (RecA-mediated autopeptidases)